MHIFGRQPPIHTQNLRRRKQRKEILKKHSANEHKKRQKPVSCAERQRFVKNRGLLTGERVGDNKQKNSPHLAKRTDFLVHKAQILVGMTGLGLGRYALRSFAALRVHWTLIQYRSYFKSCHLFVSNLKF